MSFTAYASAVAGSVLTAAFWNAQVKNNGSFIIAQYDTTGTFSLGHLDASAPLFRGVRLAKSTAFFNASSTTLNFGNAANVGTLLTVTLNQNWTSTQFTGSYGSSASEVYDFYLMTIGDGTARTTTGIAVGINWPGGAAPTPTSTLNKKDIFRIIYDTALPQAYGSIVGQNYS